MKRLPIPLIALFLAACAKQNVQTQITEGTTIEKTKYAREIEAQSPFETLTMSWTEASKLMETRHPAFLTAKSNFTQANGEKPMVGEITSQVKQTISGSVGQIVSPTALLKSLQNPAEHIPKQISSISSIKDFSHQLEESEWQEAKASIQSELTMRDERVKLHHLLRKEQIINTELQLAESSLKSQKDSDPKFLATLDAWRNTLIEERKSWLVEMRDLFDAEYHDLRFTPDQSGLTDYRNIDQPDLNDLQRWCHLQRTHQLATSLSHQHSKNKSAIPGTLLISQKFGQDPQPQTLTDPATIRKQVRSLIQSWRELKAAQQEADNIEKSQSKPSLSTPANLTQRQKIYKLRTSEIHHASILWTLDEGCWK
jgi:hypothetical protein